MAGSTNRIIIAGPAGDEDEWKEKERVRFSIVLISIFSDEILNTSKHRNWRAGLYRK